MLNLLLVHLLKRKESVLELDEGYVPVGPAAELVYRLKVIQRKILDLKWHLVDVSQVRCFIK